MALINGVLNGKFVGYSSTLQDGQTNFPFSGRFYIYGPYLIFSNVQGVTYEVTITDVLNILYDESQKSYVKAVYLQDTLYIFDDTITVDKIRSLFVILTDHLTEISDSVDTYKYIGYIFLKHGVKFEIKGIS